MLCENIYDVNLKNFNLMEENEIIDAEEKEIFREFSIKNKGESSKKIGRNKIMKVIHNFLKKNFQCN